MALRSLLAFLLLTLSCFGQLNNATVPNATIVNAVTPVAHTAADTFNRADANPMTTAASDGTSTWTLGPGALADTKTLANAGRGGAGSNNGAVISSPTFYANQSATTTWGGTLATTQNIGPMVRMQPGLGAGYAAVCDTSTSLKFYKVTDNGSLTFTQLGATITITTLVGGETIKLSVTGQTLEAFINGVSQGSRTDPTFISGQPGFFAFGTAGAIDSFSATDMP